MTRRTELPIEPLGDDAWRRIEARVLSAPSAATTASNTAASSSVGTSAWRFVGAAALAVACIALAVALWPREPRTHATTRVVTDATASVVSFGDATVEVAPRSTLVAVGDDARGWELVLSRGALTCDVAPRAGRPPFVVIADDVRVEVVGTRFAVRVDPSLGVSVERGVVRVIGRGASVELRAGERWPAARLAPSDAVAPVEASEAQVPPEIADTEMAPDVIAPDVIAPAFDAEAEFTRASRLEASAPDRADASYARVQRAGGAWAANALFARGRLAAERRQGERARTLLESYLRRYPDGLNAADARRLLDTMEVLP